MQKKDYEKIAKCIKDSAEEFGNIISLGYVARLIGVFEEDNERFNKDKFIKACGLEDVM